MITPNQNKPEHIPSLEVVSTAYQDILDHNHSHTGFGALFRGIIEASIAEGPVDMEEPAEVDINKAWAELSARLPDDFGPGSTLPKIESKPLNEVLEEKAVEGDMQADLQDIFHNDTFTRMGLKIGPFGDTIGSSSGKRAASTEQVPLVQNSELYTDFLMTLTPGDVQLGTSQATLLDDVIHNMGRIVSLSYGPKQEKVTKEEEGQLKQLGEDTLRAFLQIEPQYERLGIDKEGHLLRAEQISLELKNYLGQTEERSGVVPEAISDEYTTYQDAKLSASRYNLLEDYVTYWGRDLLPEYIEGSQYLVLPENQGFGPAAWHKDGGPKQWNDALKYVARLQLEDRTREFGQEVKHSLVSSLNSAIDEIDTASSKPYYANSRTDLENIRNFLTEQDYNAKKLADYIDPRDLLVS